MCGDHVELASDVLEQPQDESGHVVEVPVERRPGEAGLGHDVFDGQLAIRALAKRTLCRGKNLAACLLALCPLSTTLGR